MKLRFLTWNISYAYGPGSEGIAHDGVPTYEQRPKNFFESGLMAMSNLIRDLKVDVVFLQEVDFDSKRSCYIQQLDFLSRTSGLNYRLPITSWDMAYVPYPGLNPKNHFGKIQSGGGIISRFPLQLVLNDFLPKPKSNSALYNFFYLSRYLQIFKIQLPETTFNCMNLHLEAFDLDNRELQLVKMQNRLLDYEIDLAAGDFNGLAEIGPDHLKKWEVHMSKTPTFPIDHSILDGWITKKERIQVTKIETLDTGAVSDHLPVLIEIEV